MILILAYPLYTMSHPRRVVREECENELTV